MQVPDLSYVLCRPVLVPELFRCQTCNVQVPNPCWYQTCAGARPVICHSCIGARTVLVTNLSCVGAKPVQVPELCRVTVTVRHGFDARPVKCMCIGARLLH